MKSHRRFSAEERQALWEEWKRGLSVSAIARRLDRHVVSVYQLIRREGGYPPRSRRRSVRALQAHEREEISRGLAAGMSVRAIARRVNRSASTVSREIRRNGGAACYRAAEAEAMAWRRARRPQACKLARPSKLRNWVAHRLHRDWSPRQIAVGLRRAFPHDERMRISHETIYHTLFVQARGALKEELIGHLRQGRVMRRARGQAAASTQAIVDGISISERPAEAADRAVPGHWEGDLLMGGNHSQIATLVERQSRFVMLIKLDSKDTHTVTRALARTIRRLPGELRRSLTWDRGSELAAHKQFTIATKLQVYFCDPRSPWQRGTNENTNGLLRQYFPKGQDISGYTQAQLNKVARLLNERPRETLNWLSPQEALRATVATTV